MAAWLKGNEVVFAMTLLAYSPHILVTLLHNWIRRFIAMIISAWWLQASSKFTWKEIKRLLYNLENVQLDAGADLSKRCAAVAFMRQEDKDESSTIN